MAVALHLPLPALSTPALTTIESPVPVQVATTPQQAEQQGRLAYQAGRLAEAVDWFQQAIALYEAQSDRLRQAMTWGNLALAQHHLGNWEAANQAIATSLRLLAEFPSREVTTDVLSVQAQALDVQAQLLLAQGQAEAALDRWEQATELYDRLENPIGVLQSQIGQSRALQNLGFYRRAIALLEGLADTLQAQPDSQTKVAGLQSLGDALRFAGDLAQSRSVLEAALAIATQLSLDDALPALHLSLGNTLQVLGEDDAALRQYQQAAIAVARPSTQLQAQINQFTLLLKTEQWTAAQTFARNLLPIIQALPPSRPNLYARIRFAEDLMTLVNSEASESFSPTTIAELLAETVQQAQTLGDRRAESHALGSLGHLYEQQAQWADAQTVTEQALLLAQSSNAADVAYRWQWQLGRVLKDQNRRDGAIAAYREAVSTLQSLRTDLVAINPEVQFSFQESIEPIHRELVSLLLTPDESGENQPDELETARVVIESLQQAELENFFREACLDLQPVAIDQIDQQAAVLYPIILSDRLEVIVRLPNRPLQHFSTPVNGDQIEAIAIQFRQTLTNRRLPISRLLPQAQQLYDWMLRPVAEDLDASGVETLVFVLDGVLRNLPMSALHDGNRYLIERYSIALTPGLQLLAPRPLETQQLQVLAAGLTEARQGFTALPGVGNELAEIQKRVPSQVLLDQEFTSDTLRDAIAATPTPVVHLATHGQFSSDLDETFILTWGDRITINQLSDFLRQTDLNRQTPVELLVMSACQTASGDRRATLGLAGIAVRAGARSTIASLWSVDDSATAELMVNLYDQLSTGTVTKAEALRQAQLAVFNNPNFQQRPYYWAAFVLLGNWL